jgi:hypothetical protein
MLTLHACVIFFMRDFLTRMGVNIIQITRMHVQTTHTAVRKFGHCACLFNMKKHETNHVPGACRSKDYVYNYGSKIG